MKRGFALYVLIIFGLFFLYSFSTDGFEMKMDYKGPYMGQKPPGMKPEIFAPGFVSTDRAEFNSSFSPEGDEFFFTLYTRERNIIMYMKEVDGVWTKPETAPFSGSYSEVDPFFSADGKRLYFSSNRKFRENQDPKDFDFWYTEKNSKGEWGEPVHMDIPCTHDENDYYYCVSDSGTVFYAVMSKDHKSGDIYSVPFKNGKYGEVEKLPSPINTDALEHDPYIAPDESFLIFNSNREDGFGSGDLYICFKTADGEWSEPFNMGSEINTTGYEFCPIVSPDGKYFFFTRGTDTTQDIYWVDARIIENIKLKNIQRGKK